MLPSFHNKRLVTGKKLTDLHNRQNIPRSFFGAVWVEVWVGKNKKPAKPVAVRVFWGLLAEWTSAQE